MNGTAAIAAEMDVYLVGGAVRDQLLDYPVHEKDWVVVGSTPDELLSLGYQQVGRDFPVFLHPQTREEYALARTERKQGHGYQGFVCDSDPSVTLEQDLSRRDLTINAMARSSEGTLVDPYGGQRDLEHRLLRHVSGAFVEDPLRVLRVARFAARYHHLGFRVAEETLALMSQISASGELGFLASERVWIEMERALGERSPGVFFETLQTCAALSALLPELNVELQQLAALDRATEVSGDSAVRLAAMLATTGTETASDSTRRLKPPAHHRDLVRLCSELLGLYPGAGPGDAANTLELLSRADAFRRPQRFGDILMACSAASDRTEPAAYLQRAREACAGINASSLAGPGISGAEIGQQLKAARLAALENLDEH